MAKTSAGILLYRLQSGKPEVLLVHPGGPFWKNKDLAAWSVPKGEYSDEDPLAAAKREFFEETGFRIEGQFRPLAPIVQKGGKQVTAWALEGDIDAAAARSNEFEIEWPPRSGTRISIPEVDRAAWFSLAVARTKINPAQVALIDELENLLSS
jgi:predicted NUDIX family NTP pyrophosphohydrolase